MGILVTKVPLFGVCIRASYSWDTTTLRWAKARTSCRRPAGRLACPAASVGDEARRLPKQWQQSSSTRHKAQYYPHPYQKYGQTKAELTVIWSLFWTLLEGACSLNNKSTCGPGVAWTNLPEVALCDLQTSSQVA